MTHYHLCRYVGTETWMTPADVESWNKRHPDYAVPDDSSCWVCAPECEVGKK